MDEILKHLQEQKVRERLIMAVFGVDNIWQTVAFPDLCMRRTSL